MNITLYPEKCIACGLCQTISNVFDYDDEGIVLFANCPQESTIELTDQEDALLAAKSCPTKAISID
ncbi:MULTISPECIES: ferredoxin [unclassified Streptococcus]|uniref:ferredoxin n=1 Tax=unclassified Streptococcus TaxID=2608887 RepID=UPI001071AA51|nr:MULTISPECIES: ferredoxin [unclassified Streptococcus]MBF0786598.1 ferredoxin [Streptococcus sp. 19428wC2_LYSM12]MCQ9210909.1 ferredoxin [Streptococcus sp. B01]MCQ9214178.1 ferredoxin [Streptococcus sp. O1]TFV06559.1 ferredoxin [Streptococcus sp. LYSM12]